MYTGMFAVRRVGARCRYAAARIAQRGRLRNCVAAQSSRDVYPFGSASLVVAANSRPARARGTFGTPAVGANWPLRDLSHRHERVDTTEAILQTFFRVHLTPLRTGSNGYARSVVSPGVKRRIPGCETIRRTSHSGRRRLLRAAWFGATIGAPPVA